MIENNTTTINSKQESLEYLLIIKGISKVYKKDNKEYKVLEDINFKIKKGEMIGIVGESGSGKSTLARQIIRLEKPTSGQVLLNNKDITNIKGKELKNIYKDMQMVFQDPIGSFDPRLTIGKSIDELLKNNKVPKNIRKEKIIELLKLVGLDKQYIDKYPRELSGGQCQRAAIAKAISCEPKILICDEVTSALDVSVQGQVISLLKELKEKKNMTYIFICHDLALVELLCDKVIVLNKGNIVESGDAKEIINNPIHPYTKLLVNSIFPVKNKNWNIADILIDEQKENNSFCKFYNRCNNKSKDCLNSDIKLQTLNKNHFVKCNNI